MSVFGMDRETANLLGVREEDGWTGAFTRRQADGAIPNKTLVVKCNSGVGDLRPDGVIGVVLGSLYREDVGYVYFIEWSTNPRLAVAIAADRVRRHG